MFRLNEKYSWPALSSCSPSGGTADAATRRAVFGPLMPMTYAPIPPAVSPAPHSGQSGAEAICTRLKPIAPWRHVPPFLNAHHAGSVAPAEASSRTISFPDTLARSTPSLKLPTRTSVPVLTSHANDLFWTPPSRRHEFQRRPSPWADGAAWACEARASSAASSTSVRPLRIGVSPSVVERLHRAPRALDRKRREAGRGALPRRDVRQLGVRRPL